MDIFLGPSHSSYNPVILAPSILNSYERGDIIHLYEEDLKNQHVLIVKDVEKVVPEIVQDFRYYCDEENPIVSKLAIFFIMNVDQCENITEADISGGWLRE